MVYSIRFQTIFVQAFRIVVDSWKFSMLLLYILWDDWPIFMISASNQQLQQELEYTLLEPDCHSWWISKMQSGCENTLEKRYVIKFCFKFLTSFMKQYARPYITYCTLWLLTLTQPSIDLPNIDIYQTYLRHKATSCLLYLVFIHCCAVRYWSGLMLLNFGNCHESLGFT